MSYPKVEEQLWKLKADLELAEETANRDRADEIRRQMEEIAAKFEAGGDSDRERVRKNVLKHIKASIERIKEAEHLSLAKHLERSIRTGNFCTYLPEKPTTWKE